ncbi:hypothetical protein EDB85DRAFT_2147056 [Lactarius pseudohatsudake]|nr:hypothetical protein EDB85DRAFT_2150525 [Lactarius pseudohatsudake]KAH9029988.1 hypothetical protein EDB85DRAFT_2147056 [Lactarius pseudohatsudake]
MYTKHSWDAVPKNWETLGRPPSGTTIDLYISLRPQRDNAVVDMLHEVGEPGNPRYVYHHSYANLNACSHECHCSDVTKEQVADLVAPRPEILELVNSWFEHHGVSSSLSMTHGGNTLMLKAPSQQSPRRIVPGLQACRSGRDQG